MLLIISLSLGTVSLVCCGGPTIAYFVIKNAITARLEAPATPEPLTPNELFHWYLANKPTQPFVWHDPTRDDVEMIATVLEANSGAQLRKPSSTNKGRTRVDDMDGWQKTHYQTRGKAQLIFRGEQNNQELACWFELAESIQGVKAGEQVIVRGRRCFMTWSGGEDNDGSFVLELRGCRLMPD